MSMRVQIPLKPAAALAANQPVQSLKPSPSGILQRKCGCGGTANSGDASEDCNKRESTLRRSAVGQSGSAIAPPIVHEVLRSTGQPLDGPTRSFFEPRFGHDFSKVRIHTDEKAAQSASAVNALAYTVGEDVVFGARQYAPQSATGKRLIAHELAHTVQQQGSFGNSQERLMIQGSDSAAETAAEKAADAVNNGGRTVIAVGHCIQGIQREAATQKNGCDKDHEDAISTGQTKASSWLGTVDKWFTAHLAAIKRRAPSGDNFNSVGATLFAELSLLDKHFKYSDIVTKDWHSRFPDSGAWEGTFKEFETLGRASYFIRRNFMNVQVSGLSHLCIGPCPKGPKESDVLGSALPGSKLFTIYTNCFDRQLDEMKTAVILHESFHGSFNDFNHDSYCGVTSGYPGDAPVTNADSYASFAEKVATGQDCRPVVIPEQTITGSPGPSSEG